MLRFTKNQVTAHKGHQADGAVVGAGSLFWPGATNGAFTS
jgi:hypothetical protein